MFRRYCTLIYPTIGRYLTAIRNGWMIRLEPPFFTEPPYPPPPQSWSLPAHHRSPKVTFNKSHPHHLYHFPLKFTISEKLEGAFIAPLVFIIATSFLLPKMSRTCRTYEKLGSKSEYFCSFIFWASNSRFFKNTLTLNIDIF